MSKRFEGKTAIVTGASRGIGLGIAEAYAAWLTRQTLVVDGGISLTKSDG